MKVTGTSQRAGHSARVYILCCAGPVDFKSENGKESSDEAFLQLLTQSASGRAKSKKAASPTFSALTRLQLEERDVAKVGGGVGSTCSALVLPLSCTVLHSSGELMQAA